MPILTSNIYNIVKTVWQDGRTKDTDVVGMTMQKGVNAN